MNTPNLVLRFSFPNIENKYKEIKKKNKNNYQSDYGPNSIMKHNKLRINAIGVMMIFSHVS